MEPPWTFQPAGRRGGSRVRRLHALAVWLALDAALGWAAHAATFMVDTTTDDVALTMCDAAVADDCSLRGAIHAANALPSTEASTIHVPAGTYVLSDPGDCVFSTSQFGTDLIQNTTSLCVAGRITLLGAGAADTIIDGNHAAGETNLRAPVLFVANVAPVEIRGITITRGNYTAGSTSGHGGGIGNAGTLSVVDSVVRENTALGGGGIYNSGTLTVLRSTITGNVLPNSGSDGGGIFNATFSQQTTVTVIDSVVSNNTSAGNAGGLSNFWGIAVITGSTVSGNTAGRLGGAIANFKGNFTGTLTVTNSTISGNHAGNGGGIYNSVGAVYLRSVTIANNDAPTGSGGGLYNVDTGDVTVRNSLLAGNAVGFFGPDCFALNAREAALVSEGSNLIQNATGCDVSGDTTGNVVGQDPALEPLGDNGGPTPTHALGSGSVAIDHGNPSPPGSGGFSCPTIDQRGIVRPRGTTCDIGAYETESSAGAPFFIVPRSAGNTGAVVATLYGAEIVGGATVELTRAGQSIVGNPVAFPAPAVLGTSFDLAGAATGAWDVVVMQPGGAAVTLPGGFAVEDTREPDLWADVIGRTGRIRVDRPERYTILFGNRGNVDAVGATLGLTVPSDIPLSFLSSVTAPPPNAGQVPTDWSQVPIAPTIGGLTYVPLFVPVVPAGFAGTLEFTVTPPSANLGIPFEIRAEIGHPSLDDQIPPLVEGARTYAQNGLAVTLPPELTPALETYLATQLNAAIAHGRTTAVSTGSARPEVYSLPQLVVDLAQYGAAQPALARGAGPLDRIVRFGRWLLEPIAVWAQSISSCGEKGLSYDVARGRCVNDGCQPGSGTKCGGGGPMPTPATSGDPNEKVGALGTGASQGLTDGEPLRYTIFFENMATALLPAQEVVITDQLDGALVDLDTFSVGTMTFGSRTVTPPAGLGEYSATVDLRPEQDLLVTIRAGLDKSNGLVTWRFTSVDPATLELTGDPEAGFLPPNTSPPEGEGSVLFTVRPKTTQTPICNTARIVFDTNDPIDTNEWCNTSDTTPPSTTTSTTTTTSTSTTTSTTTTTIATTTSTVTTTSTSATTMPPTTTTTVPSDPCTRVPVGASFTSIGCRLDALYARVNGAELGDLQDKLLQILEKGQSRLAEATRFCSDASLKKSRKRLKQTIGDLTRYGRRLQSRAARTTLDPTLRESLLTDGQAIAGDVTVLRTAVRCRDDAIDQARARPAS